MNLKKKLAEKIQKLKIFKADDQRRDGVLINAMEVATFISAMYMGAELYKNSIDKYFMIIAPGTWLAMMNGGGKSDQDYSWWPDWLPGGPGGDDKGGSGEGSGDGGSGEGSGDGGSADGGTSWAGGVNKKGEWIPPAPWVPPGVALPWMAWEDPVTQSNWEKFKRFLRRKKK